MHSSFPAYEDLDLELRLYLDEVICAFEVAFVADPTTRLEIFLASARARHEHAVLLLELLRVELECRRRVGQIPTVEEYLLRLPEDGNTIRKAFRARADTLTGTRLGQYQLTRVIGRGAMGVVYAATDTVVNREVAVKILSESLASDHRAHEYLLREAQLVGQLLHPNIVTLFEAREIDGVCFLALEHVSGGSAATHLRHNGRFDWIVASRIILDVCQGLAAAHAVGLIHRDIKPANILLVEPESASSVSSRSKLPLAKLTDFGLARVSEDEARVGTPKYMAPEQIAHGTSNPTTDIYSLGATYFGLLTGSPPFEAPTLVELREAHRTAPVPDVRKVNATVPKACVRIVRRCLAKSPDERYQTVEALIADLDSLLASAEKPRSSRRRFLALTGLAALGLAAGIATLWSSAPAPSSDDPALVSAKAQSPAQSPDDSTTPVSTKAGSWEPLFNGRNFTGWQVRGDHGVEIPKRTAGFTVKTIDGEPAVRGPGNERHFYLCTLREYENYHLSLEYKWIPPLSDIRNAGVLYHCRDFDRPEFQGHEFDLLRLNPGRYDPHGTAHANVGHAIKVKYPSGAVVKADAPLNQNYENVAGKWNRLDLICVGDSALHILNSKVVLTLVDSRFFEEKEEKPLTRGRIMLQSYFGAIAYRRIKIRSIDGIPPEFLPANGG